MVMNVLEIREREERNKKIYQLIQETTRIKKIQAMLLNEYQLGNIMSLPTKWYFYEENSQELKELQRAYNESKEPYQRIPEGLFNIRDGYLSEIEEMFNSFETKIKQGIIIDFLHLPEDWFFGEDDSRFLLLDKKYQERLEILKKENQKRLEEEKRRIKEQTGLDNISDEDVLNCLINFEETFRNCDPKILKAIELETLQEYITTVKEYINKEISLLTSEDAIVCDGVTNEQMESLEKQRCLIEITIDSLRRTGALQELINTENEKIDRINDFLPNKNKIENIKDESTIYKFLYGFDLSKQEDIVKFYAFGRHFLNKFAHNEDYIYGLLNLVSISQEEYKEKKINGPQEHLNEILEIFGNGELSEEKNEKIKEKLAELDTLKSANKFMQAIEGAAKGGKSPNELRQMIINWGTSKFHKNAQLESENVIEYFGLKIECLKSFINQYEKNISDKFGSEYLKKNSFEQLFFEIINGTVNKDNYKHLEYSVDVNKKKPQVRNVVDDISDFIFRIKLEGIIKNPEDVLPKIVDALSKEEYSAKQFFTDGLIVINEKIPGLIRIEHDETEEGGLFNIMLPRTFQILGTHYKYGDFDAEREEIRRLPKINAKIQECYTPKNKKKDLTIDERTSLSVCIPIIGMLSDEQVAIFNELFLTTNFIDAEDKYQLTEEQKNELREYGKLKELKEKFPQSYNAMKIRFALVRYMEMYRNEKSNLLSANKVDLSIIRGNAAVVRKNKTAQSDVIDVEQDIAIRENEINNARVTENNEPEQ